MFRGVETKKDWGTKVHMRSLFYKKIQNLFSDRQQIEKLEQRQCCKERTRFRPTYLHLYFLGWQYTYLKIRSNYRLILHNTKKKTQKYTNKTAPQLTPVRTIKATHYVVFTNHEASRTLQTYIQSTFQPHTCGKKRSLCCLHRRLCKKYTHHTITLVDTNTSIQRFFLF